MVFTWTKEWRGPSHPAFCIYSQQEPPTLFPDALNAIGGQRDRTDNDSPLGGIGPPGCCLGRSENLPQRPTPSSGTCPTAARASAPTAGNLPPGLGPGLRNVEKHLLRSRTCLCLEKPLTTCLARPHALPAARTRSCCTERTCLHDQRRVRGVGRRLLRTAHALPPGSVRGPGPCFGALGVCHFPRAPAALLLSAHLRRAQPRPGGSSSCTRPGAPFMLEHRV